MRIETMRFGEVEIDDKKVLTFQEGLPGLEDHKRFAVLQFEESNPIVWLQSVDSPSVALPVTDSFALLPDYSFNIRDEDVKELELNSPEDLHVMNVMVIPDNIEEMTINLAAPIIINLRTGQGRQIILPDGNSFHVRYPIFNDVCRVIREGEGDAGAVTQG